MPKVRLDYIMAGNDDDLQTYGHHLLRFASIEDKLTTLWLISVIFLQNFAAIKPAEAKRNAETSMLSRAK
jgi:hypothetical protein